MTPESNRVFTVGMEWRGRREEKGREAPIASRTQNLEPSRRQDSPAATYLCQKGIMVPLRLGLTAPPESDYSPSARFRHGTEEGPERSGPFPFRHPKGKLFRRAWLPTEPSPLPNQRYNSF